jgi:hypothetical protein
MQGADLLTSAEILGHKDLKMTRGYAHVASLHRLAALGLLENAYGQGSKWQQPHSSCPPRTIMAVKLAADIKDTVWIIR